MFCLRCMFSQSCFAEVTGLLCTCIRFPPFFCIIKINQNQCLESFFFDKFIILRKIQSFASPFPKIRKWHSCFFYQNCNILIPKLIKKQHLSTFLTRSHYRMGNNKPSHFKTHYLIPVFIVVVTQIKPHRCIACFASLQGAILTRASHWTPRWRCIQAYYMPHTRRRQHQRNTSLSFIFYCSLSEKNGKDAGIHTRRQLG